MEQEIEQETFKIEVLMQYVESCAYHESAHIVIAAVQGLPLKQRGLRIDQMGCGLACYHFKTPDGLKELGENKEREKTIRATNAGYIAQCKFYPGCPYSGACHDRDHAMLLLDEMYSDRRIWFDARDQLNKETGELIDKHWDAISRMAQTLWNKPWQHQAEAERRWSLQLMQKSMEGPEIVNLLQEFCIRAAIV